MTSERIMLLRVSIYIVLHSNISPNLENSAYFHFYESYSLLLWRKLFRVPWTARRSNQSILKEISSEYSLEGLMLKLKFNTLATWCEELTHWKRRWCWKRLKAVGEGDDRGWDGWMASLSQWTRIWASSRSCWWTGKPGVLWSMAL